jgi:hypothetical protein
MNTQNWSKQFSALMKSDVLIKHTHGSSLTHLLPCSHTGILCSGQAVLQKLNFEPATFITEMDENKLKNNQQTHMY